jgi:hypothetical protein
VARASERHHARAARVGRDIRLGSSLSGRVNEIDFRFQMTAPTPAMGGPCDPRGRLDPIPDVSALAKRGRGAGW